MEKMLNFDVKLVRTLQEEVVLGSNKGPIDTSDGFGKMCPKCYKPLGDCACNKAGVEEKVIGKTEKVKTKESKDGPEVTKLKESVWFGREKLNKMKARLAKVRTLYKKYKDNDKYEREGVSLENEISELQKKLGSAATEKPTEAVDDTQVKTAATSKDTDNSAPDGTHGEEMGTKPAGSAKLSQTVKKIVPKVEGEVAESAPTITEPTTKPDIAPTPTPVRKPQTPITPQPHISPKPKALNNDVALFARARGVRNA